MPTEKVKINRAEIPPFLSDFLSYLRTVKGRSERTVTEYYQDIRSFFRYLILTRGDVPEGTPFSQVPITGVTTEMLSQITLTDVYDFLTYIADERDNHARARARKTSAIKGLYKYLTVSTSLLEKNPVKDIELPRQKKSLPKFLSLDESVQLLDAVDSDDDKSLRNYCILTLFLNCGMRLSELVGINRNDINYTEHTLRLLGKGNKERIVYINDACVDAIRAYTESRENTDAEPHALFLSSRGTRISKRRVQQITEDALRLAELDGRGLSVHKLRHTAATLMYQHGGVDTRILKEILGHESIATTEIYTHVSSAQLQEAADSSPLSVVRKKKE